MILVLSAMGNASRIISKEAISFEIVSKAIAIIYLVGFIIPLVLDIIMKIFGSSTSYA